MLDNIFASAVAVAEKPTVVLALVGVFALIIFSARLKKISWSTGMLVNISLMLAATVVLNQLRIYHFPQGGAVTLGGMLPLLLVSWRYGANVGMLTGFVYGIICIMQDPFLLHPVQVLFDYPLPFMAVGLAAHFKDNFCLGAAAAFAARFACHFFSGVVFFGEFAPVGTSAVMWSLYMNGSHMLVEGIICLVLIRALPVARIVAAMDRSVSRG